MKLTPEEIKQLRQDKKAIADFVHEHFPDLDTIMKYIDAGKTYQSSSTDEKTTGKNIDESV
jgi:hypothetical protein